MMIAFCKIQSLKILFLRTFFFFWIKQFVILRTVSELGNNRIDKIFLSIKCKSFARVKTRRRNNISLPTIHNRFEEAPSKDVFNHKCSNIRTRGEKFPPNFSQNVKLGITQSRKYNFSETFLQAAEKLSDNTLSLLKCNPLCLRYLNVA